MKPEPVNVNAICSACGLTWENHGTAVKRAKLTVGLDECVRLLKAELAKRPQQRTWYWPNQPWVNPTPYYGTSSGTSGIPKPITINGSAAS